MAMKQTKKTARKKAPRKKKPSPEAEQETPGAEPEYIPASAVEGNGDMELLPRRVVEHPDFVKFAIAKRIAQTLASSQLVPRDYVGRPNDCFIAIQMGEAIGLNPFQAIQSIAVINGRPCVWGDALIGVCRASPACEWIEESFDDETMTATCATMRKGDRNPIKRTFSQEDAERAGLWKTKDIWRKYPKRMLQMRARAFCLRDAYPDALKGLHVAEEVMDYDGSPAPVREYELPAARPAAPVSEVPKLSNGGSAPTPETAPEAPTHAPTSEDTALVQKVFKAIDEATTLEALLKAADLAKSLTLPNHVKQAREKYQLKREWLMEHAKS